jgi:hypothetical protein
MAKGGYSGVENVSRKIKKGYIGDANGTARKIKKAYVGDEDGKARLCWTNSGIIFTYYYSRIFKSIDNGLTWSVAFYNSSYVFSGICIFDNKVVVSGTITTQPPNNFGVLIYSSDGVNWITVKNGSDSSFASVYAMTTDESKIVMMLEGKSFLYTTDLKTFTKKTIDNIEYVITGYCDIAYHNNRYVIVGYQYNIAYLLDNNFNVVSRVQLSTNYDKYSQAVAVGGGMYAVSGSGDSVANQWFMHDENSYTKVGGFLSYFQNFSQMVYFKGLIVAMVGYGGSTTPRIQYSSGGGYTLCTISKESTLNKAYTWSFINGDEELLLIGTTSSGFTIIYSSSDGKNFICKFEGQLIPELLLPKTKSVLFRP